VATARLVQVRLRRLVSLGGMQQTPMRQVVRAKIPFSDEIAERLDQAGILVKATAMGAPQRSFIAEVDAPREVQALQALRRALEPWGEVPLEPLGRRGKVLVPPGPRR
jgi:hypothetical protein